MAYKRLKQFKESYGNLPEEIKIKTKKAFKLFKENPRHPSLCIKKIQGLPRNRRVFEGRVDEYYRFTFEVIDGDYCFRNVGRHDVIDEEL